jgi:hypothetical protein
VRRKFGSFATGFSLLLFAATVALWARSYQFSTPPADPHTGASNVGPQSRTILPLPGDADQYVAVERGNLERWEYTPWDGRWYRLYGVPLVIPVIAMLLFPTRRLFIWHRQRQHQRGMPGMWGGGG